MLDVLGTILLVVFALMIVIAMFCDMSNNSYGAATITVGVILLLSAILSVIDKTKPTAIDVYRNKTTLEVTYKSGVTVDSIVVFKNKK